METEKLEVEVDDLLLDLENPRIGSVTSQPEALEEIVRLSTRNFKNMMHSIREHGLDPGDSFYLVQEEEEGDGYTVVDGNRRLAALKVLNHPDFLQSTFFLMQSNVLSSKRHKVTNPRVRSAVFYFKAVQTRMSGLSGVTGGTSKVRVALPGGLWKFNVSRKTQPSSTSSPLLKGFDIRGRGLAPHQVICPEKHEHVAPLPGIQGWDAAPRICSKRKKRRSGVCLGSEIRN